jgi:hypothetical protein
MFTATLEGGKTTRHFETSMAGSFAASWAYDCDAEVPLVWVTGSNPDNPLSNASIETERSGGCPISAETDANGHILLENLQTGMYAMTIRVEPCGVSVVCHVEVESGGQWEKIYCLPLPATGTVSSAALVPEWYGQ